MSRVIRYCMWFGVVIYNFIIFFVNLVSFVYLFNVFVEVMNVIFDDLKLFDFIDVKSVIKVIV